MAEPAPASQLAPGAVCVVRQPVFDAGEEVVGYRVRASADGSGSAGGLLAAMPQGEDAELALADELYALAPHGLVFLSVSPGELVEGYALALPTDRVVLCMQAAESIDAELRDAVDRHAMRGFRLALDVADPAAVAGPLLDLAQTVTFEVGAHSPEQLEVLVASMHQHAGQRKLVAGGVDSRRSFDTCWLLGIEMFQGQFFLSPTAGPSRTVATAGMGGIGTMAELTATENFEQLAAIITRDPGLSMRFLRYANSAHVALPRRVGSVHEALAWLGTVAVRDFALIAALANVPEVPAEMLVTALTRARMCEQLSRRLRATNPEESFTVGLFSVAEAVTNAPMATVLGELPLREDVVSALVAGAGELGHLLAAVIAYERGYFTPARTLTGGSHLIAETYNEAIRWADSAVKAVA